MATTYTSVLRLAKPTTGELSGTWGDTVNDNVTTMIEQAITGKATVAMADTDQTLTTANGTTDQARCMMVECTGAMTANHNVVCPTATKMYIVNNLTTGGKSIVFKTTGGTGITILPSTAQIVYCDGTNVVAGLTGYLTSGGALGTPSSGTLTSCTGLPAAGVTNTAATLSDAQTFITNAKTFTNSLLKLLGSSTGATTFTSLNAGASNYTLSFPAVTDTLVALTTTDTLTNKRVTPRILSAASYTTDTGTSLNCDNLDEFIVTAQAGALKLNNPTGTPTDGQVLIVAVTGTAARALTYDTQFQASTVALPTTTVTTNRITIGFIWSAATSKWICVGSA